MACMNEKTFDIYYNDLRVIPDGYVEIDELIAPTIQMLNRKGYITGGCCSGHSLKNTLSPINGKFELINGRVYNTHIVFKEGVSLPILPPGFVAERKPIFPPEFLPDDNYTYTLESLMELAIGSVLVIRKSVFDGVDFFETSRNILETNEQLYKWASYLPDFKDEG